MTNEEIEKLRTIEQMLILLEAKISRRISEILEDFEAIKSQLQQLRQLND